LGFLNANYFLGGGMHLDEHAARQAITSGVAKPLGLTPEKAAWGIHGIVTENMAAAIRIHMAEKGVDPSRFTLVAFGGGGTVGVATGTRVGIARDRQDGENCQKAQRAPTETAIASGSRTQHRLSPTPLLGGPRPPSWLIYSVAASRQFTNVGERGLQILKLIPRILRHFSHCNISFDFIVQCTIRFIQSRQIAG
jgi:hypothetical protein